MNATEKSLQKGGFITFEGIDGAGKSTHIAFLSQLLKEMGREVVLTREPGGTELGEKLRELLLHEAMYPETEALLMFAARQEHIRQVIEPALKKGMWVISDRFTDASFAYQGGGRSLSIDKLRQLENWVHPHLQPDLTLLFDVDAEIAASRVLKRIRSEAEKQERDALAGDIMAEKNRHAHQPDKFETEKVEFFQAVRAEYLRRAAEYTGRFRVIDSAKSIEEIQVQLKEIIHHLP